MDEDDANMQRAAQGDTRAFDLLIRRHQGRVQRFVFRMVGDRAAQGDIAVETFLRLWESRLSYRPEGKVGAWLLRTAYRLSVDELRRRKGLPLPEDVLGEGPLPEIEGAALGQAVREAIGLLPEGQRAVIVLTVYEGLSNESAAEILDVPAGTVASRKSLALRTLRRRLAAWEDPR